MNTHQLIDILQNLPDEVKDATIYFHGNNLGILNINAVDFQIVRNDDDTIIDAGVFLMEKNYSKQRGRFPPLTD